MTWTHQQKEISLGAVVKQNDDMCGGIKQKWETNQEMSTIHEEIYDLDQRW